MKPDRVHFTDPLPIALAPLRRLPHWVVWRWVKRKGAWTKPPYMATAPKSNAKNNDPATWSDYPTAAAAAQRGEFDGIGFALLGTDLDVVDLDHCRDPETGDVDTWADVWLHTANDAYVELTPSGEGLRIIGLGSSDGTLHRKWKVEGEREGAAIEIYRNTARYVTVTGQQIGDCTALVPTNGLLEQIRAHYDGKSKGGANGHDFNDDGKQGAAFDYDEVIRNGAPAGSDVSAVFHSVVGHLHAQGMTIDEIVGELGKYINGIGRRYPGRLQREVERCYGKWQSKRRITAPTAEPDEAEPDEPNCWAETDKKGNPRPTCANARRSLLALGIRCRYDEWPSRIRPRSPRSPAILFPAISRSTLTLTAPSRAVRPSARSSTCWSLIMGGPPSCSRSLTTCAGRSRSASATALNW
jgi:hypothetical protein